MKTNNWKEEKVNYNLMIVRILMSMHVYLCPPVIRHSFLCGNCKCGLPCSHYTNVSVFRRMWWDLAAGVISGSDGSRLGWPPSLGCWCDTYLEPPEHFRLHHVKRNIWPPLALCAVAAVWCDLFCSPANFSLVPLRVGSRQEEKNDSSCQTALLLLHHLTSSLLSAGASLQGGTSLTPLVIWGFCCSAVSGFLQQ